MRSWISKLFRGHPVSSQELSDLVDGRLDARRDSILEAHVSTCDFCRRELADLRSLKALLAAVPQADAPRSFALSPEVASAATPAARARSPGPLWAPALALTVLVLLVGVDALSNGGGARNTAGDASLSTQKTAAGAGNEAFSNAAPVAPAPRTADSAAPPSASPAAAGGAAAAQSAPTPAADATGASAQQATPPVPAPPVDRALPANGSAGDSGVSTLRVLEFIAALALIASLVFVLRYRHA